MKNYTTKSTKKDGTLYTELFKDLQGEDFPTLSYARVVAQPIFTRAQNTLIYIFHWQCQSCKQKIVFENPFVNTIARCPHCNEPLKYDWEQKQEALVLLAKTASISEGRIYFLPGNHAPYDQFDERTWVCI